MDCFQHAPTPAVGICRACGRGVCHGCARSPEDDLGLACSERCIVLIGEANEINERAKRIYGIGAGARRRIPMLVLIWGMFAVLFGTLGAFMQIRYGGANWFFIAFALVCAALCVISYRRARELNLNC
ncbi:MAG: hypothetical protein J0H15_10265 [Xanthomonadales bacterium]|nr:hypothetical protein [Xanthomonadales bacterium]